MPFFKETYNKILGNLWSSSARCADDNVSTESSVDKIVTSNSISQEKDIESQLLEAAEEASQSSTQSINIKNNEDDYVIVNPASSKPVEPSENNEDDYVIVNLASSKPVEPSENNEDDYVIVNPASSKQNDSISSDYSSKNIKSKILEKYNEFENECQSKQRFISI